jgi:GH18 family chitinase
MIMSKINIIVLFHIFLSLHLKPSTSQTWIKSGYWYYGSQFPISDINSTLFTHLICAFADVNSESSELSIAPTAQQYFSTFTDTVRQKNPSITTLLSIGGGSANYKVLSLMVSKASYRKSFIDSSMKTARLYGFQGLEFNWASPNTSSDMTNMGILFQEWRAAVNSEAKKSNQTELILTASVRNTPFVDNASFPVDSIRDNLNWVHAMSFGYHTPQMSNVTGPLAPLYDPLSNATTDYGIHEWIRRGLSAGKLVMALPFYGYAWKLKNPNDNDIGSPATGPAITDDGLMSYKQIKAYIQDNIGAQVTYNAIYVVKSCIVGSVWIGFDDVEVVKQNKLLGYVVWQLSYDDNSELSLAGTYIRDRSMQQT